MAAFIVGPTALFPKDRLSHAAPESPPLPDPCRLGLDKPGIVLWPAHSGRTPRIQCPHRHSASRYLLSLSHVSVAFDHPLIWRVSQRGVRVSQVSSLEWGEWGWGWGLESTGIRLEFIIWHHVRIVGALGDSMERTPGHCIHIIFVYIHLQYPECEYTIFTTFYVTGL